MKIQVRALGFFRRPRCVCMPGIRPALERAGLPLRLLPFAVKIVPEERGLNILAELAGRLMSSEWDESDAVALRSLPFSVEPRSGYHEVRVLRIVFFCMPKNLPGSPRIFLIPETGNVKVRHRRGMKLIHPCFLLPEFVVVGMIHAGIPVRNRAMQIFGIDI